MAVSFDKLLGKPLLHNHSGYVSTTGDTMTGLLTLSGAPTADLHAATKKYVDDTAGSGGGASTALDNLASVDINASLLVDTDSAYDLGSSVKYWANAYLDKIYLDADSTIINTDVDAWNAHLTNDGSDHSFIDQSVVSGATPTFTGTNFTGIDISAGTNLAVTSPIVLTDDTLSLDQSAVDHGTIGGLSDDDHTQYILHSLAAAANDFLVASGANTYVKKTLAETGTILEGDIDHGNLQGLSTGADHSYIDQSVVSGATPTFTGTNITGVPAASILAGTFGTGAYVFDNAISGITTLGMGGNLTNYEAVNDGNPEIRIGSADANEGHIQAVYNSGAQTLDYLEIKTDSAGEGDIVLSPAGNVGIGTTGPTYKLDVSSPTSDVGTKDVQRWGLLGQEANYNLQYQQVVAAGLIKHVFNVTNGGTPYDNNLVLDRGNVGIGGTVPSAKLSFGNYYINTATPTADQQTSHIRLYDAGDGNTNYGIGVSTQALNIAANQNTGTIRLYTNSSERVRIANTGYVGIGTTSPANPLAVNRSADGVIVDFESADTVEGNVSISGNTTSYNAFVGSHYTQLKDEQSEPPVGAVVVSTGEIIPCEHSKEEIKEVLVEKDAFEEITIPSIEAKEPVIKLEYYIEDGEVLNKEIITPVIDAEEVRIETRLKENHRLDKETGKIYRKDISLKVQDVSKKEYFTYVDTTTTKGDKRAYGVWFGKMSDDAKGMSFGQDNKPVYLIAQVGFFKIRVTDTNGNIENGDYLETSERPMEAQKQTSSARLNSTVAKALVTVDWTKEKVDTKLNYKWKLISCTF